MPPPSEEGFLKNRAVWAVGEDQTGLGSRQTLMRQLGLAATERPTRTRLSARPKQAQPRPWHIRPPGAREFPASHVGQALLWELLALLIQNHRLLGKDRTTEPGPPPTTQPLAIFLAGMSACHALRPPPPLPLLQPPGTQPLSGKGERRGGQEDQKLGTGGLNDLVARWAGS